MNPFERTQAELTALLEICKVLNSSFNLIDNLNTALKLLSDYLDMQRGTVTLYDKTAGELRIVAAFGLTPEQMARGRYKVGEGIVGRVFETGEPIIVPNIGKEPLFLNRTGARIDKNNISFLCVPIKLNEEILGVLSVDRIFDESISFEEDLRVLGVVSVLIAQAIKLYETFEKERSRREELEQEIKERYQFHNLVFRSQAMREIVKTCIKVAKTRSTVLIRGESGTGKELLAKAIHMNSDRSDKPFVAINCAAIPETLLEAELFGFEKGAFTSAFAAKPGKIELAHGGTLFLDEVGDMPLSLQVKLLRFLQDQTIERLGSTKPIKVDVRVICATNRPLEKLIQEGKFREDLYFRLNVVPIFIPPLRERKEDIPVLVEHFLKRFNELHQKRVRLSPKTMNILLEYPFPGNIRELENLIERLVLLAEGEVIEPKDLPFEMFEEDVCKRVQDTQKPFRETLQDLEKDRILKALIECNFNQSKAAKKLGYTRRQLSYRIEKYNLKAELLRRFS
jgi:Nif-specific regulatory protein